MVNLIKFILSLFLGSKKEVPLPEPIKKEEPLIKKEEVKVSGKVKHVNNGSCPKCEEIFNKYPGFHSGLKQWFKEIQTKNPEAHISAAGRGKAEQEEYFQKGTSKAHYGQSSHNFNAAIDIFKLHLTGIEWPKDWFTSVVEKALDTHNNNPESQFKIKWYGKKGSPFFELPHCEIDGWKNITELKLVE